MFLCGTMKTTRERILEAARETFIKKGYKGATTRKIAQRAGVSEVTLFRKFKSKSNLLKEILNENATLSSQIFNKLLESELRDKPEEFLYRLAEEFFKLVTEKKIDLIFIILVEKELEEHGLEEWELLDSINKTLYSNLTNYFKEQIKKGQHPKNQPRNSSTNLCKLPFTPKPTITLQRMRNTRRRIHQKLHKHPHRGDKTGGTLKC